MEWLNAFLDLVDATLTALGWVMFWFTWVSPRRLPSPAQPSSPDELKLFIGRATSQ